MTTYELLISEWRSDVCSSDFDRARRSLSFAPFGAVADERRGIEDVERAGFQIVIHFQPSAGRWRRHRQPPGDVAVAEAAVDPRHPPLVARPGDIRPDIEAARRRHDDAEQGERRLEIPADRKSTRLNSSH